MGSQDSWRPAGGDWISGRSWVRERVPCGLPLGRGAPGGSALAWSRPRLSQATGEGRARPANPGGRAGRAFLQNRVNSGEPSGSEARALTDTYQAPRSLRGGNLSLSNEDGHAEHRLSQRHGSQSLARRLPECPRTGEWTDRMWCVHPPERHSATRRNGVLTHSTAHTAQLSPSHARGGEPVTGGHVLSDSAQVKCPWKVNP